ncbi:MAG: hypothetical protein NC905_01665 [Candidatus Omnitrophica bacterium]|nr:hypothetical protein [Candidatus Omnitrophota bacterium]MCM8776960.1 hypothetical protein [Candidatus Omnitrophota bacterium]
MKQNYLFVYAITVLMCSFAFICFLLNQLHLDLRDIRAASEGKTLRGNKLKEWEGTIFSIIIIISAVIFVVLAVLSAKMGSSG